MGKNNYVYVIVRPKTNVSHSPKLPPPVTAKRWVVKCHGDETEQRIDDYEMKKFEKREVLTYRSPACDTHNKTRQNKRLL